MSTKSNDLAIVPVVLMIAMSPSMLNAKTPVHIMPVGEEKVSELIAQPNEEVNDATYVAKPEQFQQDYPLGVAYLSTVGVKQIKPAIANNNKANVVLAGPDDGSNLVRSVYLINENYKNNNPNQLPPVIRELIYHNIGADREYLGVIVKQNIYPNEHSLKATKAIIREYRLDDESAQFLLDLNAESTKWKDETGIRFKETTNPNTARVKSYNY